MQIDQLKRRDFITLLAGAAVWPVAARAQQPAKLHRIFWASTESQPDPFVDGFREGLRERGYIEGVNVVLDLRYAPGNPDALRAVISELTRRNWDLAVSSGPAIRAMKAATDIPVLFAISGDPVELGLVKTLRDPAATLREARSFRWIWPEKGFNCLRIRFRNCARSRCYQIRIIRESDRSGAPLSRRHKD
jgi:ABC transporter substrate binding protein